MFSCVAGKLNNAFHPHATTKGGKKKNKQTQMQMLSMLKPSNSKGDFEANPNSLFLHSISILFPDE